MDKIQWKRIRKGERLPCDAYLWSVSFSETPGLWQGKLIPNMKGVEIGADTWYLPVQDIHDLEKEEPESEDERIRKELIEFVCKNADRGKDLENKKGWLAWLEKQKEQKPAEWSEEEEKTLISVICGELELSESRKEYFINLLKSLRPSWKPSEEHLSALLAIFNDMNNIGSQTCQLALSDLYEQLKKL